MKYECRLRFRIFYFASLPVQSQVMLRIILAIFCFARLFSHVMKGRKVVLNHHI